MPIVTGLIKENVNCDGILLPSDPDATATIKITNTGTGNTVTLASTTGQYSQALPPGAYRMTAEWDDPSLVLTSPNKTNEMGVVDPASASLTFPVAGKASAGLMGVSNPFFLDDNSTEQINVGFFRLPEVLNEAGEPEEFEVCVGSLNADTILDDVSIPVFFVTYTGFDTVTFDPDGKCQFVMMDAFDNLNVINGFSTSRDKLNFKGVFFSGQVPYDGDTPIADGKMVLSVTPGVGTMVNVQFNRPGIAATQQIFLSGVEDFTDANVITK